MSIIVGVDPGMSGAIALIDSYGALIDAYDMPVVGGLVSAHGIVELEGWDENSFGMVVIEDVHSMPKQGVASSFGFGRSKGVVEGVFAALGMPIAYVSPQKWKKALGLSSDKGVCRRRAIELWPAKGAKLFARVKDDGRAEAALIAYWWLRHGQIGGTK
jgi:crossover junction endodeoxyribonuclease RuvC